MSKFYGKVGYSITEEKMVELDGELIGSGVYETHIVEKNYSCELIKNISKWSTGSNVNDNIDISNQVSILADPYAYCNFAYIRYIEFMGVLWKVNSVEVQRPRLVLSIGGKWNGESSNATEGTFDDSRYQESLLSGTREY